MTLYERFGENNIIHRSKFSLNSLSTKKRRDGERKQSQTSTGCVNVAYYSRIFYLVPSGRGVADQIILLSPSVARVSALYGFY